jgi:hypothetical protein
MALSELYAEEIHNLCASLNTAVIINIRAMLWSKNVESRTRK